MTIRMWVIISTVCIALGAICIVIAAIVYSTDDTPDSYTLDGNMHFVSGDSLSTNKLLALKLSGVIVGDYDDTGSLSSGETPVSGYDVKDALYQAADDDSIQGVVLEINSPGGTIYGAHAIADGVAYYRSQTHKPIIAYVQGLAASGAYWSAVSTDKIIADYGSDVGSIGVIAGPYTYYDNETSDGVVVTQNGIHDTYITAGTSKDIGNPSRKLTADEIARIQQSVNDDYDTFVSYVSERRHISPEDIRNKYGAMTYGNKAAEAMKLIDKSGGRQDAYEQLALDAKLDDGNYQVVRANPAAAPSDSGSSLTSVLHRQKPRTAEAQGSKACTLNRVNLAYYGDTQKLCK